MSSAKPVLEQSENEDTEESDLSRSEYARAVGSRLRLVRQWLRLSLQAVEAMSGQEFKASVLGAYERGERAISLPRFQRLAKLYQVPVDYLLPQEGGLIGLGPPADQRARPNNLPAVEPEPDLGARQEGTTVDMSRLDSMDASERELLRRFLSRIQLQRQDSGSGRMSIRAEDVRALQNLFGMASEADRPTS